MKKLQQKSCSIIIIWALLILGLGNSNVSVAQYGQPRSFGSEREDTVLHFKCNCGVQETYSTIKSIPVLRDGNIFKMTYFDHYEKFYVDTLFTRKYFDYLYLRRDTIFIIAGYNDTLLQDFVSKSQILCVLRKKREKYILQEPVNFFRSLNYSKSYFSSSEKMRAYSYFFDNDQLAADLPAFTRIDFSKNGVVVYYEFNSGFNNQHWRCKRIVK